MLYLRVKKTKQEGRRELHSEELFNLWAAFLFVLKGDKTEHVDMVGTCTTYVQIGGRGHVACNFTKQKTLWDRDAGRTAICSRIILKGISVRDVV